MQIYFRWIFSYSMNHCLHFTSFLETFWPRMLAFFGSSFDQQSICSCKIATSFDLTLSDLAVNPWIFRLLGRDIRLSWIECTAHGSYSMSHHRDIRGDSAHAVLLACFLAHFPYHRWMWGPIYMMGACSRALNSPGLPYGILACMLSLLKCLRTCFETLNHMFW